MRPFILSFFLLSHFGSFLIAKEDAYEKDFWAHKMIQIDPTAPPTLEFICLENDPLGTLSQYINNIPHSFESIIDVNFDHNSSANEENFYLSSVSSESINQWLVRQYIKNIELNLKIKPFLNEESSRIAKFLQNQKEIQLEELAQLNEELAEMNMTDNFKRNKPNEMLKNKRKPSGENDDFTQFALYLIIGGGVCLIYSVLAPPGSSTANGDKTTKIKLARRKRWLDKVFEKGWIDRPTYHFLLKRIETLPRWLGGIKPTHQSENASEKSVTLSRRNKGESVVKTKDTSEDKTSR
jgi:hypothetical protein